jgi:hypothetical protein
VLFFTIFAFEMLWFNGSKGDQSNKQGRYGSFFSNYEVTSTIRTADAQDGPFNDDLI